MSESAIPTAAILIVGNEILSGRTLDSNSNAIAKCLAGRGIEVREVRVVGDHQPQIIGALNDLRKTYDLVFTTGGIGPTHDDITADAVAAAFGVGIAVHPEALRRLAARYADPADLNEMRMRMARIPEGASLIDNPLTAAPGFRLENVFVLAGVPAIMKAMLEGIEASLPRAALMQSVTIAAAIGEGAIAAGMRDIQNQFPMVSIGSYPKHHGDGSHSVELVARSRDGGSLALVGEKLTALIRAAGVEPEQK